MFLEKPHLYMWILLLTCALAFEFDAEFKNEKSGQSPHKKVK